MHILILTGLTILGFTLAIIEYNRLQRFLKTGIKAKGKRVGFTIIIDHDRDKIKVPILEYSDSKKKVITTKITSNIHNKRNEIDIIYDPTNPKKVIADYWSMHFSWLFLMTFGILSLLFLVIQLASR